MVADGLLTRQRYREVPPRVDYELTERSRELMPVLGALARWGYDWTWGAPRPGEEVNVGAILRLAPGLLEPTGGVTGSVEFVVHSESSDKSFVLTLDTGEVSISERPGVETSAKVTGDEAAWVAALGPEGATDGLDFEGKRPLADAILSGFIQAARTAAVAAA